MTNFDIAFLTLKTVSCQLTPRQQMKTINSWFLQSYLDFDLPAHLFIIFHVLVTYVGLHNNILESYRLIFFFKVPCFTILYLENYNWLYCCVEISVKFFDINNKFIWCIHEFCSYESTNFFNKNVLSFTLTVHKNK